MTSAPAPSFAAALLTDQQGRYLVQIRDDTPGILHPGAFGLFGGGMEPGEDPETAIARELEEEIGLVPPGLARFRLLTLPVRYPGQPVYSASVMLFQGSIDAAIVPGLRQMEGAGRALISPRTLLLEQKVALVARLGIAAHAEAAIASLPPGDTPTETWMA